MTDTVSSASKSPKEILANIFAFSPNRETLGGTAYFMRESTGNVLIDCPIWDKTSETFLEEQGGVRWWILTHRGGMSQQIASMQEKLQCEIFIQEQEAYLITQVSITPFRQELSLNSEFTVIWTAGHSPGSSCIYGSRHGGVLFTGRHLLPNQQGFPVPLRIEKTFHWPRQLSNVAKLLKRFTPDTLSYLCPGANTGFLRGKGYISNAYHLLKTLDLDLLLKETYLPHLKNFVDF